MPNLTDRQRAIRDEEIAEFIMSFVKESDELRDEYKHIWLETAENYLMKPYSEGMARDKDYPLTTYYPQDYGKASGVSSWSMLKDSESHQVVETLLGSVLLSLFGEPGFIQARRRGLEDTFMASTTTRLLEYDLEIQGHYRTFYQWLKDAFIFGTGIMTAEWDYIEAPELERSFDLVGNIEVPTEFLNPSKVQYDDPRMENVDLLDFFPMPGETRLNRMRGCVKRFTMLGREALDEGKSNPRWDLAAVKRAVNAGMTEDTPQLEDLQEFEGLDRPVKRTPHPDYIQLTGYEFFGEVPWKVDSEGGTNWQVLTCLGGETVAQKKVWPFKRQRLPFYDFTVNPMTNRFYGISPLETARFSQDFADTVLNCIADAVVKMTHPPWLVDRNANVRSAKLREFHPNVPIETDKMDGVEQLTYAPPLGDAMNVMFQQKQGVREMSGANNVVQGLGFSGGVPRSASAASIENQRAGIRPETIAQFIEKDALPQIGQALVLLNQQFLDDSGALQDRIGSRPNPASIFDIMADQDIKFVGSRSQHNRQTRVEAYERAAQVIGQLPVAQMFPWAEFMVRYLRDLDLHELEQFVADPQSMQIYGELAQQSGGGNPASNGNDAGQRLSPSGLEPAQAAGRRVG